MNFQMRLLSSHSNGSAKIGETVCLIPVIMKDDVPLFSGKIAYLGFRDTESFIEGTLDLSRRGTHIVCRADKPTFFRYSFRFESKDVVLEQEIGVIFAPEMFHPHSECPVNLSDFWAKQLAQLLAIPCAMRLSALPSCGEFRLYDLTANCVGGVPVSGELAVPENGATRFPAIIIPQGAGGRGAGVGNTAWFASQGFLALDLNAHGLPNGRTPEFYRNLVGYAGYPKRGFDAVDPTKIYMTGMFLRVKRALEVVCSLPEWDGRHLFLAGASQGAWQCYAGAFLDSRVTAVATTIPAGCDLCNGGWPFTGIPSEERARYAKHLPYFDGAHFLAHMKMPLLIRAGLVDTVCRPDGVAAAFNVCPSQEKMLYWANEMRH